MFFKKKKPDPSSEMEHQAIAPGLSASEKSMFAPGLNPQPTQIDFGLGGFNPNVHQPYSGMPSVGSYDPWASSVDAGEGKPPSTGTEDWMSTNYIPTEGLPSTGSGGVTSPVEPDWQLPPVSPLSAPSSGGQPTADLTPEQSWSMMDTAMPQAQSVMDYSTMDFAGGSSAESPAQSVGAGPTNPDDEWMKAFEGPGTQFPDLSVPAAPFSGAMDSALNLPPISKEEDWAASLQPEAGYRPEHVGAAGNENLLPPLSTDFESELQPDWSTPAEPLQSQNLATTGWPDGLPAGSAEQFDDLGLPLPDGGFMPSTDDAQFLGINMAPAANSLDTSLDTRWESSLPEAGTDLHSRFGSTEQAQPTWNITEPNLGTSDLSPDLAPLAFSESTPSSLSMNRMDNAFDPLEASQDLTAGWSQYEQMLPAVDNSADWPVAPLSNLSGASWTDEQIPAGTDWVPPVVGNAPEPVYFHEAPVEPISEAQLWNNLNSPDFAPGEQVPYASGAMMDSINEQLYPEDPFTAQNEFAAGEQAFADAAQYLFPETVNAPLDWADSGYGSVEDSESGFYGGETETTPILELGPSYSSRNEGFAELSSASPERYINTSDLNPYVAPPQPEAFVGFPDTQHLSGQSHLESAFNAEDEQWLSATPVNEPAWSAGVAAEPALYQSSAPIEEEESSSAVWMPQSAQGFEGINPGAGESATVVDQSMNYAWQSSGMEQSTGTEYEPPADAQPKSNVQSSNTQIPLEDDADFYATAFTLNELGELVPVHDNELMQDFDVLSRHSMPASSLLAQPQTQAQYGSISAPPLAYPSQRPSYLPQEEMMPAKPQISPEQFLAAARSSLRVESTNRSVIPSDRLSEPMRMTSPASSLPPAQEPAAVQQVPVAPEPVVEETRIRPRPLNRKMPEPRAVPEPSVELQWYNPVESALDLTPPPSSSEIAMKLTLGNLEVLGICQLSVEKRLLVVHHDGVYALMGQGGQDKADVNVLKVFEHHPLAYQHTFTAVEEGNAAGQGMYVTQVGTWHAIISTFQDKITLHTELG